MDDGPRPGLFAKGGVGRFLLGLTVGAIVVFVVVCGGFTAVTTAVIGAGTSHYMTTHEDEIEAASKEGTAFAQGHTITDCVSEGQQRAGRCTDLASMCAFPIGVFAGSCARTAEDDGYCAAVPTPSDTFASTQWKKTACAAAPTIWCEAVMVAVQRGCDSRKEDAARTTDEETNPE